MSDTVGRIDLILDIDGKRAVGKIRKAGEKAGREAGEGFNDNFGDEITKGANERNKEIGKEGRKAGESYSDARDNILRNRNKKFSRELADVFETPKGLSNYVNKFDDAKDAYKQLRYQLTELHKANLISDEDLKRNRETLRSTSRTVIRHKDAANALAAAQERLNRDWDEAIKHNKAYDQAVVTNQRNIAKWRKSLERDLVKSLDAVAKKQRETEKASASWAKSLERARKESERLDKELGRLRIATLNVFKGGEKGIGKYADRFPTIEEGSENLRKNLERLRNAGKISGAEFTRHAKSLDIFNRRVGNSNNLIGNVIGKFTKFGGVLGVVFSKVRSVTGAFSGMPYILKQIAGYTALFTALAPAIAVLGSATGSGALALATNVGALGLAVVTLIPAFKGMLDDIEKLPEAAQPAAQALQNMAGPLSDLQDTIQSGVWKGLGPEIENLTSKVFPVLTDGFGKTATTINGILSDMMTRISSKENLGRLERIFDGLQPILDSLGGTIGNVTGAFATLFEAALPSGQNLAGWLEQITGNFNNWLKTTEGQAALTNFFDHLNEIMPAIGTLIGSAGKAVSMLVTDKAVDNLTNFFDTMSEALPKIVGPLGTFIDHLDPLGGAAKVLERVGQFFSDHEQDLAKFGTAVQKLFDAGFDYLGPIISDIADAILKVAPDILDDFTSALEALNTPQNQKAWKETIPKLADVFVALADAISGLIQFESKTGIVSKIIETIGNAAEVAAVPISLLGGVFKLFSGDLKGFADVLDRIDFTSFLNSLDGLLNLTGLARITDAVNGLAKLFGFDMPSKEEMNAKIGNWLNGIGDFLNNGGVEILKAAFEALKEYAGNIASIVPTLFKALFGFGKGKGGDDAEKAGKKGIDDAEKGAGARVLNVVSIFPKLIAALFGFGGGKKSDDGKKAGEKAVDDAEKGAKEKAANVGSIVNILFGALFKGLGDFPIAGLLTGPFAQIPGAIGGALNPLPGVVGGIMGLLQPEGQKGADNTKRPFEGVNPGILGLMGPLPGLIGGVMGLVTGQQGADNTKNPFAGVSPGIMGLIGGVPSNVTNKIAEASGKRGADNSANPFDAVLGNIMAMINSIPARVAGKLAEANGQMGADNSARPFNQVPGNIQRNVSPAPSMVQRILGGISDFGAAGRIVAAFQGVPGLVQGALSGLGGIVERALSAARRTLDAGIGALNAGAAGAVPKTAIGGTFNGAQMRIIGEAGPEAVVPLNRPLSQVDPSVRALSAIAQGKFPLTSTGGKGKSIVVEEGAIMVQVPNADPEQAASAVLDRLVANL